MSTVEPFSQPFLCTVNALPELPQAFATGLPAVPDRIRRNGSGSARAPHKSYRDVLTLSPSVNVKSKHTSVLFGVVYSEQALAEQRAFMFRHFTQQWPFLKLALLSEDMLPALAAKFGVPQMQLSMDYAEFLGVIEPDLRAAAESYSYARFLKAYGAELQAAYTQAHGFQTDVAAIKVLGFFPDKPAVDAWVRANLQKGEADEMPYFLGALATGCWAPLTSDTYTPFAETVEYLQPDVDEIMKKQRHGAASGFLEEMEMRRAKSAAGYVIADIRRGSPAPAPAPAAAAATAAASSASASASASALVDELTLASQEDQDEPEPEPEPEPEAEPEDEDEDEDEDEEDTPELEEPTPEEQAFFAKSTPAKMNSQEALALVAIVTPESTLRQREMFFFEEYVRRWPMAALAAAQLEDFMQFVSLKYTLPLEALLAALHTRIEEAAAALLELGVEYEYDWFFTTFGPELTEQFRNTHDGRALHTPLFKIFGGFKSVKEIQSWASSSLRVPKGVPHIAGVVQAGEWTLFSQSMERTKKSEGNARLCETMQEEANHLVKHALANATAKQAESEQRRKRKVLEQLRLNQELAARTGQKVTQTVDADGRVSGLVQPGGLPAQDISDRSVRPKDANAPAAVVNPIESVEYVYGSGDDAVHVPGKLIQGTTF